MRPKARIDIFESDIILTYYGEIEQSYPVDLADVGSCFAGVPLSSGLLPPNTLFWQRLGGRDRLGIYIPPARYQLPWDNRLYDLPMPGFVFAGHELVYEVYAVKEYPIPGTELYHAPTPNVYETGKLCRGNVSFPYCTVATMNAAWAAFVGSGFTDHLANGRSKSHPHNVRPLWNQLDGAAEFPLDELLPAEKRGEDLL